MKTLKSVLVIILVFTSFNVNSQSSNDLKIERQKNRVEMFSSDERNELQIWFYHKTESMQLSDDEDNLYHGIIVLYMNKMMRLDDMDQDFTQDEIIEKVQLNFDMINSSVQPRLSDEQYTVHLGMMDVLCEIVMLKINEVQIETI
ncbi:hypothetical protein A9Q87_02610 [Flavobacteriales bacterium 34_180_T64]|nr:hypothetical protein A9Q87_02610 [Flavobacteriales bacterium 34_180_T64]